MRLLRSKGQYVLKDVRFLKKIIRYADLSYDDVVLEVGCGTGKLTRLLLKNVKKVYGIEIDQRFVRYLQRKFRKEIEDNRFELIHGDALKVEFPKFDKFIANIPYKISSPLTFKLFKHNFKLAVITYQKEFAERLIAKPGSKKYGRLSVVARAYCRAEILDIIPPEAFVPRPRVESAIVRIVPEPEIEVRDKELFEDMIRFVFSNRRKMLGKVLKEWAEKKGISIKVPDEIKEKRAEDVDACTYAEIVNSIT